MFFWFIATSILVIHYVFTDPQFDYRMLIVGSIVPILGDVAGGWMSPLNSVTIAVGLLAIVMVTTIGRRQTRRFLLGLPIGFLLHSVFGASWNTTEVFWWPFAGIDVGGIEGFVFQRGIWSLLLEAAGIYLAWWIAKKNDLTSPRQIRSWSRDGRLTFS